jgi:hypothetical protein
LYYKIRLLSLSKGTIKKDGPLGDGPSKDQDNVDDRAAQRQLEQNLPPVPWPRSPSAGIEVPAYGFQRIRYYGFLGNRYRKQKNSPVTA